MALPDRTHVELDKENEKEQWRFPKNGVLAKTLSIEMQSGNPESRRAVETQILHYDGRTWRGYSYAWNDQQTDAMLVNSTRMDRELSIEDPQAPQSISRANLALCQPQRVCSVPFALERLSPLAFNYAQLNKRHDYGSGPTPQLARLVGWGFCLSGKGDEPGHGLVDPYDSSADLEERARSYLHVNCAHCHRDGGGGTALWNFSASWICRGPKRLTRPYARLVRPRRRPCHRFLRSVPFGPLLQVVQTGGAACPSGLQKSTCPVYASCTSGLAYWDTRVARKVLGNIPMSWLPCGARMKVMMPRPLKAVRELLSSTQGALSLVAALDAHETTAFVRKLA